MKTIQSPRSSSLLESFSGRSSLVVLGLFVLVMSAQRAFSAPLILVSTPPPAPVEFRLGLGTITVIVSPTTATTSVDSATGRLRTAGDGAAAGALATMEFGNGDPYLGVIAGVFAPIGAAVGAVRASSVKVPSETLEEARQDVAKAIQELARPEFLRESFLKTARERTRRRFVAGDSQSGSDNPVSNDPNGTTLTLSVEDFRLSRSSSSDTSFALLIRTRARLVRSMDGAVLYDQPFEFQSGQCLFIHWTLNHADPLKKVAETGYRHLADRMVQQVFLSSPGEPLIVGSGVPSPRRSPEKGRGPMMAGRQPNTSHKDRLQPVANLSFGGIGIYSTPSVLHVAMPTPVTRNDAIREAREDVDSDLDGLQNCPNPLISIPAIATAIPMSLYRQTVAAFRGLSAKKASAIEVALRRAGDDRILHQELGQELSRGLEASTSQMVVLLPGKSRAAENAGFIQVGLVKAAGHSDWTDRKASHDFLVQRGISTVLEIEVVRAGLKGGDQLNAAQCLEVAARVRVRRAGDGLEIHSFPVQYRSRRHSFSEWAAHDARIFRQELDRCSRDISTAVAENLVACGIVNPSSTGTAPILAVQSPSR